jgi:hypothetical protein
MSRACQQYFNNYYNLFFEAYYPEIYAPFFERQQRKLLSGRIGARRARKKTPIKFSILLEKIQAPLSQK